MRQEYGAADGTPVAMYYGLIHNTNVHQAHMELVLSYVYTLSIPVE